VWACVVVGVKHLGGSTQLEPTRRPVNNVYAFSLCVKSTGRAVPIKSKHSITEKATNAHTSV